jgi:peptidoglycan/xylan/chitin deacetylase (PgdA/CDA1 family)
MSNVKRTYISFTVDVDPDINVPSSTKIGAFSHPVEEGNVRFESVERGLKLLVKLLDELEIESTFFFEARTARVLNDKLNLAKIMHHHEVGCHSYEHEDFTAASPELRLDRTKKQRIIEKSLEILHEIFPNHDLIGFRAPYIKIDLDLARVIEDLKFTYDSSMSLDWDLELKKEYFGPRYIKGTKNKLIELPLPVWKGPHHRSLSSYLWPILESDRTFNEYWAYIDNCIKIPNNELIILATHPWHLVETYKKGNIDNSEIEANCELIKKLLTNIKSIPFTEILRLDKYLTKTPVNSAEIVMEN